MQHDLHGTIYINKHLGRGSSGFDKLHLQNVVYMSEASVHMLAMQPHLIQMQTATVMMTTEVIKTPMTNIEVMTLSRVR